MFDALLERSVENHDTLVEGARVVDDLETALAEGAVFMDTETCRALQAEGYFPSALAGELAAGVVEGVGKASVKLLREAGVETLAGLARLAGPELEKAGLGKSVVAAVLAWQSSVVGPGGGESAEVASERVPTEVYGVAGGTE